MIGFPGSSRFQSTHLGLVILLALTVVLWAGCGSGSGGSGSIVTVAGDNAAGFQGDGGLAINARLNSPSGVAIDASGNMFIADTINNRIRKVASGNITTIAGNGFAAYAGDGLAGTSASLNGPSGVAVDGSGNVYVADQLNNVIRKITSAGIISTIAGTGVAGYNGDGIAATTAQLNLPAAVAVDSSGNVFIADFGNNRVREVASSGSISTVAGTGVAGKSGDSGPGTSAQLSGPAALALDSSNNLFIADEGNNVIRKLSSGTITTIAGNGTPGDAGDNGPATSATISNPVGVAVNSSGVVYISDAVNQRVRKVSGTTISIVAGNGTAGYVGDGSAATKAELNGPHGLAVDKSGSLYIADSRNQVIRKVTF